MDLGIKGKRALVTAASKGLGRGCAEALAQAGVDLVINARGAEALEATATHLRSFGVDVVTVCGDVTSDAGLQAVLAASAGVDILVTNAGGPPPGSWENWTKADYLKAIEANMLTPIALMTALMPAMIAKGCGIADSATVREVSEVAQLVKDARTTKGPVFRLVKVMVEKLEFVMPPQDGAHLKDRFRQALGIAPT